jgi:hypothetical protein
MTTATANETTPAPVPELKIYRPSASLLALTEQVKLVAKFDPGIIAVFEQATRINAVTKLMESPEMEAILEKLEGSPAGFTTDIAKDGKKYPPKERNMAVSQALQQGARLVNKEFGIIRGNSFLQKPFYKRMLDELGHDGAYTESCRYRMLWWDTILGEIALNGPIATCTAAISYKLLDKTTGQELKEKEFKRTFQIKTFPTDTPDLWAGKFERRAWQKLLAYLSGVDFGDDGDEGGATPATPPPVGTMAPAAAPAAAAQAARPAPKAEDAQFTEVKAGPAVAAQAPPETTSKPQAKTYAEMSPEERRVATAQAHAQSSAATESKPAPAPGAKPELF